MSIWDGMRLFAVDLWVRLFFLLDLFLGIYGPYMELALVSIVINFCYSYKMVKTEDIRDNRERTKLKIVYSILFVLLYAMYVIWRLVLLDVIDLGSVEASEISESATARAESFPMDAWVLIILVGIVLFTFLPLKFGQFTMIAFIVHISLLLLALGLDFWLHGWNPYFHPWECAGLIIFFYWWRNLKRDSKRRRMMKKKEA